MSCRVKTVARMRKRVWFAPTARWLCLLRRCLGGCVPQTSGEQKSTPPPPPPSGIGVVAANRLSRLAQLTPDIVLPPDLHSIHTVGDMKQLAACCACDQKMDDAVRNALSLARSVWSKAKHAAAAAVEPDSRYDALERELREKNRRRSVCGGLDAAATATVGGSAVVLDLFSQHLPHTTTQAARIPHPRSHLRHRRL